MCGVWLPFLIVVSIAFCAGVSSRKAQIPVDLELVLAVDCSASVDNREFELRVRGMARASRDPSVVKGIRGGPYRAIVVAVVEWASTDSQIVDIPWTIIDGPEAANHTGALLDTTPRAIQIGATSISGALRFAASLFGNNGFDGVRQVIDLS